MQRLNSPEDQVENQKHHLELALQHWKDTGDTIAQVHVEKRIRELLAARKWELQVDDERDSPTPPDQKPDNDDGPFGV